MHINCCPHSSYPLVYAMSTGPRSFLTECHLPPPPFSMPCTTSASIMGYATHTPLSMHCCCPRYVLWPQSCQILAQLAVPFRHCYCTVLFCCIQIQELCCCTPVLRFKSYAATLGSRSSAAGFLLPLRR